MPAWLYGRMSDLREAIQRFREAKQDAEGHYMAFCPVHPDGSTHGRRSLSLTIAQDRLLVSCFNGCSTDEIVRSVGLEMSDLFADSGQGAALPQSAPELTLEEFCRRRKLDKSRLMMRWQVREVEHRGRPALEFNTRPDGPGTPTIKRYKYLDRRGDREKVWWKGGHMHWYGLGAAREHGDPLYLVNGEPSVWACDQEGVAAVCLCAGEGTPPSREMVSELRRAGFESVRIVYDLDKAGREGALKVRQAIAAAGMEATVLQLPAYLGEKGDVDDLHRWHGDALPEVLSGLPEIETAPPPTEWRREGDDFTITFWADLVRFEVSRIREASDGTHAELRISSIDASGKEVRRLLTQKLNLLAPNSRTALSKALAERLRGVDWAELLEHVSSLVLEELRRPEPVLVFAEHAPDEGPVEMLFSPLAPKGDSIVLFAAGGSLKSYLALSLAVSTAAFLPLGPIHPHDAVPVLYLDWETTFSNQLRRLTHVARAFGLEAIPPDIYYRRVRGPLSDNISEIRKLVQAKGIGLVVTDSISRACADLETSSSINQFFDALDTLVSDVPVTKIVLSHITKAGIESRRAKPFGSIMTENAARATWELRAERSETRSHTDLAILLDKANDLPEHPPIGLRAVFDASGLVRWETAKDGNEALEEHAGNSYRITRVLRSGHMTVEEISQATGITPKAVDTTLRRMERADAVVKVVVGTRGGNPTRWGLRQRNEAGA